LTLGGITASNKEYDANSTATVSTGGATYTGLIGGDFVTVNATGVFADKNAATDKTVTLTSGYTGADVGNYSITNQASTLANITAKALTVSATGVNRTYDATTDATVTLGDNRIADDVLTDAYTGASFLNKNAATGKTVNVSGISISGADATNYSLSNTTATTTADITPVLVITDSSITAVRTPIDAVTGDTVIYTGGTARFSDKNVANAKTATGTGLSLSGIDTDNYTVNSPEATKANIPPATPGIAENSTRTVPTVAPVVAAPQTPPDEPAAVVVPAKTPLKIYVPPQRRRKPDRN